MMSLYKMCVDMMSLYKMCVDMMSLYKFHVANYSVAPAITNRPKYLVCMCYFSFSYAVM